MSDEANALHRRTAGEAQAFIEGWAAGAKGILDFAARRGGLTAEEVRLGVDHAAAVVSLLRGTQDDVPWSTAAGAIEAAAREVVRTRAEMIAAYGGESHIGREAVAWGEALDALDAAVAGTATEPATPPGDIDEIYRRHRESQA